MEQTLARINHSFFGEFLEVMKALSFKLRKNRMKENLGSDFQIQIKIQVHIQVHIHLILSFLNLSELI